MKPAVTFETLDHGNQASISLKAVSVRMISARDALFCPRYVVDNHIFVV
jgi:hypothetical protein